MLVAKKTYSQRIKGHEALRHINFVCIQLRTELAMTCGALDAKIRPPPLSN